MEDMADFGPKSYHDVFKDLANTANRDLAATYGE